MPKRRRENPCFICGHFHRYEEGEICGICGHAPAPDGCPNDSTMSAFPSELLPGFLFVGSYDHASRSDMLKFINVKRILNLVPTSDNLYRNSFEYETATSSGFPFAEFNASIERGRQAGERMLMHCMSGRSRAPTAAVGYLMWREKWRLPQAYEFVRQRVPQTHINPTAAAALQAYEAELFELDEVELSAFPDQSAAQSAQPVLPPTIFGLAPGAAPGAAVAPQQGSFGTVSAAQHAAHSQLQGAAPAPAVGVFGAPATGVFGAPATGVFGAPATGVFGAPATGNGAGGDSMEA